MENVLELPAQHKTKLDAKTTKASQVFNGLILSYIVLFFNEQKLFGLFDEGISAKVLAGDRGFESRRLQVILNTACSLEVLQEQDGVYRLTELGHDLARNRGFFTWAIGGYGPLLEAMGTFVTQPATPSLPYVRGEHVAIGSDECNQELMEPIFQHVLDDLPVSCVADLGCGNAGRLTSLLKRRPELTGVGIDINIDAITAATSHRDNHKLTSRLQLVHEDVFASLHRSRPEFKDVELVMSFMMLHDLFNIKELDDSLFTKLKTAFPRMKYLILADTCLDEEERTFETMPIFAAGYELIHALRGIELFPLRYYEDRFARSGLKVASQYKFGAPNTYIFVLEV